MVGLCLVAVLAVAVVAASSASAKGPEWGQCFAKEGGKYADSGCQTKAKKGTGTFEWRKATQITHRKFSGGSEPSSKPLLTSFIEFCKRGDQNINPFCEGKEEVQETEVQIECESETNSGEISGKNGIANVVAKFHGCALFGSAPCENTGTEGEVVVNVLKGTLGYINKSGKEVGVLLEPAAKKGLFAQFSCAGTLTTEVGSAPGTTNEKGYYATKGGGNGIISTITPVNTMASAFTQNFSEVGDENVPSKFEGKPMKVLESLTYNNGEPEFRSAWSRAAEVLTNINTGEEEAEIKA